MSLQPLHRTLDPKQLRRHILDMAMAGSSVHVACAFSLVEIAAALYGTIARLDARDPRHPGRDLVCLSKGHGVMALYACFLELGWLERHHFDGYFADGSMLKGLGEPHVPGLEVVGGSLGHGLPVAVGLALGAKLKSSPQRVFCIAGDGEMNEGSMWESLLFAAHWRLDNLTLIIDANEFQAMGRSTEVLNCEPFAAKMEAFGFETSEIDGHDVAAIVRAAGEPPNGKPRAIVARTVKGKGVSFMERDNRWHYTRLTQETLLAAKRELS